MPFVSSNAFAACQAITFSYGADGWTTSGEAGSRTYILTEENKVNVVRYFKSDATNGRYWFFDRNCTIGASNSVLIPLNGSFNAGVPVGFVPLHMGLTFATTEFAADELKEGSSALYTFSYNVEEKYMSKAVVTCSFQNDVAVCGLKSGVTAESFIESVKTYGYKLVGGYLMSLKNSAGYDLNSIRLTNGQLITEYVSTESAVKPFRVSSPLDDTETMYFVDKSGNIFADGNRAIRVFSMPVVSDVTQSGVVVRMLSQTTPPTINTSSLFNDSGVYEGAETVSIPDIVSFMLCSYSQEEDLSGNEAVSHCRFNTKVKAGLYSSIGNSVYYPLDVFSPAAADVLAPGSFQLSYVVNQVLAFVDYPCYKASIYGIEQRAANTVVTSSPVLSLYNKNGVWYSDSSCSVPLGDDNSFDIEVDKTLGVPYLYGTDASAVLMVHSIGGAYGPFTGLPFMCNYRYGQTVVTCTWLVDTLLENTSYYPTDYAVLGSSIREIISTHRTDGSVSVNLSSTACYTLSVNLSSGIVINMYYDSVGKVWRSRSCTGNDITAGGITVYVSTTGNIIPVSFSTTSSAGDQRATIDGSYDNKTNVYVLYDAHKDSSTFTLKPTGAITADTTLYPTYTVPSSSAESLVMTYSNQMQHLKNYYQIKIMENDSMPETVFYHDESGYYDSRYFKLLTTDFSVSLNDSATKVPVVFQYTEVESPVIKSESNWGGLPSFLFCDYDSVESQRTMNCRLPSLGDTANHTYYVISYAELDNRKLKIVGGANPLTAYCNPLVLKTLFIEPKTYYSQYYQDASTAEYRIRWYSDDACTTELTENLVNGVNYPFRLPLVQYNGVYAVPFLFNEDGVIKAPVEAGSSEPNPGPIYCVYNSAENSADCMFNWVNGFAVAGVLGVPVSTLTYSGGKFAKIVEGKVLTIENNIVEAETEIVYEDKPFCNVVRLTTPRPELKYDYHTDGINWYSFADTNCEQPVELVLPMLDGAMPIYFNSGACLQDAIIYEETPKTAFAYRDGVPCLYSSKDDVVNCEFDLKTMTNYENIFCVSNFVRKCISSENASCELNVTKVDGFNSLNVDYINCCLAGYHDENGVSSTLPIGQTSCK